MSPWPSLHAVNADLIEKMSAALVATGWWMAIDVSYTPNAVVICVIIFNAAFGYRQVVTTSRVPNTNAILSKAGDPCHGYILLRYLFYFIC